LRSEDSEADASGGREPPADPVKALWDRGLAILGEKHRSLLGKMRQTYGAPAVLAAIVECENECPSDPPSYFIACCERRKGNGRQADSAAAHARAVGILGNAALDTERPDYRSP